MEQYDGMVFYRSFYEAIKEIDKDTQLVIYSAIFEYGLNGEEIELSGTAKSIFGLIKPQIDANNRRRKNGFKGGRPKTKTEPNNNQTETKLKPKEKEKGKDKVKELSSLQEDKVDCKAVAALFNDICTSFPRIKGLNASRENHIRHLLKNHSEKEIEEAFQKARDSAFMNGDNKQNWKATFDWIIIESNFQKVIEGNYDNARRRKEDCINDRSEYGNSDGLYESFAAIMDDAKS